MTTSSTFAIPPIPVKKQPVRELLDLAGLDVSDWAFTKDGDDIENPNDNIGRNTNWSFIGTDGEPTVLCVWYKSIDWDANPPVYRGNEYVYEQKLIELTGTKKGKDGLGRLNAKIKQARRLHQAVYDAKSRRQIVKLILVDGVQVPIEESAEKSSTVRARGLDHAAWYVHECDGESGNFLIVRGVQPVLKEADPFADLVDPGEDPAFRAFISTLGETEREVIIKARVGQGPFRDGLIDRWGGCSVTGCGLTEVLIASHIKPWSKCETPAERLGAANGLLLTPNLDRLFDRGLVSFDDNFRIAYSPLLKDGFAHMLNVDRNMRLKSSKHTDMRPFLDWHRQFVFRS
jgi:hypothetical protein